MDINSVKDSIESAKGLLSAAAPTLESVKSTLLGGLSPDVSKISSLTATATAAVGNLTSAIDGMADITSSFAAGKKGLGEVKSLIDSARTKVGDVKSALGSIAAITQGSGTAETSKETDITANDKEGAPYKELTREQAMAYDSNGLKHYMNIFLETLTAEGVTFTQLGARRWAVDVEDNKVYGNAFLERQSSKTFKTLDSDGKLYWLSDYNSRHYYGEAVDIGGSLEAILDKVARSAKVLDVMHHFGICMQIETSESGHSKGTHYHCSTDGDNPQTKWWGVVNRIRESNGLRTYTVVVASDYYETEKKNPVQYA